MVGIQTVTMATEPLNTPSKNIFDFDKVINYFKELENNSNHTEVITDTSDCGLAKTMRPQNCTKFLTAFDISLSKINIENNSCPLPDEVLEKFIGKGQYPILTLFTTWIHVEDKVNIHENTIKNWASFRPFIKPVLFSNDSRLIKLCRSSEWDVLPLNKVSKEGIPVLKNMFIEIISRYRSTFYGFANSDILFTSELIHTLHGVLTTSLFDTAKPAMFIGQRKNVENMCDGIGEKWKAIDFISSKSGSLFHEAAQDYFITNKIFPWKDIPEVVIGRIAYDNWLVIHSSQKGYQIIDATKTLLAVHQTTKYGNFEGFKHSNMDYNIKLLAGLFGEINYQA
ncbi:hypothetical protein KUTeg_000935, partial [Tegillarca granosa]